MPQKTNMCGALASERVSDGVVIRLCDAGLAFIQKRRAEGEPYAFTFDKIYNYRGETAVELGLAVGSHVQFTVDEEQRVQRVKISR